MMETKSGYSPNSATAGDTRDSAADGSNPLTMNYRKLNDLKPNPANPRRHSRAQIRRLAEMIRTFGFRVPLLVGPTGMIVAGHGRWEAARLAGLTEVPTILVQDLSDAEIKAFIIADNRIAELATWDDALLAQQFVELAQINPELSLELTGFETAEIDLRIESLTERDTEKPDPADVVPASSGPAVTSLGDMWVLGPHRIFCADARDGATYATLLGTKRAGAVFTDPPYNVPIDGHASGLGRVHHREFAMASGEMTEEQYAAFLTTVLHQLAQHSAVSALFYLCLDWRHVSEGVAAAEAVGCELLNICVWVKHNPGMGSLYRSQHEFVLVLKHGRGRHHNNVQLGRFGRNRSNVWHYRGANDFGRSDGEGNLLHLHPTVKPVAMIADAIVDCTERGDIVLDAFLGSGSTVIAAARTGRNCYGIEIDPLYVDTAIRRWQVFTRGTARHAVTGLTFDETAQRREAGDDH